MIKRILPLAALFLAAAACPALASDHSLELWASTTTPVAGQPMLFKMTGTAPPPAEYWGVDSLTLVAFRPSVMSECPPDEQSGTSVAENAGGVIITIFARLNEDGEGNFENIVGYTPQVPGPELFCGYVANEVGYTLATASTLLDVRGAGPANVRSPRVKRSGNRLSCDRGSWSGDVSRYSYGWRVDGRRRNGGRKLAVTRALRGHKVQCSVTASNAGGATTAVSPAVRIR